MKKVILLILLAGLGLGAFWKLKSPYRASPRLTVTKVVDGDTIKLSDGRTIRYIGIDTPELDPEDCFAREAGQINQNLVWGKTIKLETDTNEMDQFGRILAYVYADTLFVNQELLFQGAGKYYQDDLNTKYQEALIKAAEEGREAKNGLWGKCAPDDQGCLIKGNLDWLDRRWYHLPEFRHYAATVVNLNKHDQWFCTEQEAQEAGFKKARE